MKERASRVDGPQNPWPFARKDPELLLTEGFTDDEIARSLLREGEDSPKAPWMFWASELYSVGKCFRRWIGWPERLPLPVYADHGVLFSGVLVKHERESAARIHLVWSRDREHLSRDSSQTIVRIPHPWVSYRRELKPRPSPQRRGTLAFYPHATEHVRFSPDYRARYLDQLRSLGPERQPVVVMLHMHDANPENVAAIRGAGFGVVTAGNTLGYRFVDRFYDLVDNFEHGTSPTCGSQVFFCHEFGLKYFLHGDAPVYYNHGDENLPLGERLPLDDVEEKNMALTRHLFSSTPGSAVAEKDSLTTHLLGLDATPDVTRLKRMLVVELIRLWRHEGSLLTLLKRPVRSLIDKWR